MLQTPERVYYDPSLKKNADEHLEIVFNQINHWDVEGAEGPAIARLIDPYTTAIYGDEAVPFGDALKNSDKAIDWALQFGEIRIVPILEDEHIRVKKELPNIVINFSAKIIRDDDGAGARVYADTLHKCILLAGVQVLRDIADRALNQENHQAKN